MISGKSCLLISRVCEAPSGLMRVKRERAASMRTLKRSFRGTSGPATELFSAGLDSKRTACAREEGELKNDTAMARKRNTARTTGPGDMIHPFANCNKPRKNPQRTERKDYTEAARKE